MENLAFINWQFFFHLSQLLTKYFTRNYTHYMYCYKTPVLNQQTHNIIKPVCFGYDMCAIAGFPFYLKIREGLKNEFYFPIRGITGKLRKMPQIWERQKIWWAQDTTSYFHHIHYSLSFNRQKVVILKFKKYTRKTQGTPKLSTLINTRFLPRT